MPGFIEAVKKSYKKLTGKTKQSDRYRSTKPSSSNAKTAKENEAAANEGYEVAQAPEEKD